jgi:CBS domain-containing protein
MLDRDIKRLPGVEGRRLAGIVTRGCRKTRLRDR